MTSRRVAVLVWLVVLTAAVVVVLQRGTVRTDMTLFLPDSATPTQRLVIDQIRTGLGGGVVLVAIEGLSAPAGAKFSGRLAQRLRASDEFAVVANGSGSSVGDFGRRLFEHRYLLSDRIEEDYFRAPSLRREFEGLLQALRGPLMTVDARFAQRDPTGEFAHVMRQWMRGAPQRRGGVWVDNEGRPLLFARPRAPSYDLDAQDRALETVRHAFDEVRGSESAELVLAGAPVIALATRAAVKSETRRISLLAGIGVLVLLAVGLRSLRWLALCAVPVASGVLVGCAVVLVVFGGIHGITLAFGATLLGITLDYPIHLHRHRSTRRVGRPLLVGVVTTAAGFTALVLSGLEGLAQLGVFAVAGIVTAGAVTYWVLPSISGGSGAPPGAAAGRWAVPVSAAPWGVALVLIAVGIAVLQAPGLHTDLVRLVPLPHSLERSDQALRQALHMPGARYVVVVRAASEQAVLRASEAVGDGLADAVRRGDLERYDSLARMLPSVDTQKRRRALLPGRERLRASVQDAVSGLPLKTDAFEPFIIDIVRSSGMSPMRPQDLEGTPFAARVEGLLRRGPAGWQALIPLGGVADAHALRLSPPAGAHVEMIDLKQQAERMLQRYERRTLEHALIGGGFMLLVLVLALRDIRRVLVVVLTAAGAVMTTVSVMGLTQTPISLFHLVAMLLVVGLGLDYALFATEDRLGGSPWGSVTLCAATTVIAFGVLATAKIPVLEDIGTTVTVGVVSAWLLALLLSPFARGGPWGRPGPGDR